MLTILIHIQNEDPILAEIDELPKPVDNMIIMKNPRKRDGKDMTNLEADVTTIILPVERIHFIEVMPSGEEEEIIGFVRE